MNTWRGSPGLVGLPSGSGACGCSRGALAGVDSIVDTCRALVKTSSLTIFRDGELFWPDTEWEKTHRHRIQTLACWKSSEKKICLHLDRKLEDKIRQELTVISGERQWNPGGRGQEEGEGKSRGQISFNTLWYYWKQCNTCITFLTLTNRAKQMCEEKKRPTMMEWLLGLQVGWKKLGFLREIVCQK